MLCTVYKSLLKPDTYLYINKRDDFSNVPEPLLKSFGTPQFVMIFNLADKAKLAIADKARVVEELNDKGFYLQLPPPEENLLETLREQLKVKAGESGE